MASKKAFKDLRDGLKVVGGLVIKLTSAIKQDVTTYRYERAKKFISKVDSSKQNPNS